MVILREAQSLEELCSLIGTEEVDIDEVIDIYKMHPDFDPLRRDPLPLHHYTKHGKDIAVKRALRRISEKYPRLRLRKLSLEWLKVQKYVFRDDSLSRVIAYRITKRKKLAPEFTYETLVTLNGSCLFIESRLGGARFGERGRYRIDLLEDALGCEVKHVQVVPPEFIGVSKPFLRRGYLAPFFMPASGFKEEIELALQRHRLPYTNL